MTAFNYVHLLNWYKILLHRFPRLTAAMTPDSATPAPAQPEAPLQSDPAPAFGWTYYAERMNGRFAMVGFVALLLLELVTGQDFFSWLGMR
jgi:hypothetical protein